MKMLTKTNSDQLSICFNAHSRGFNTYLFIDKLFCFSSCWSRGGSVDTVWSYFSSSTRVIWFFSNSSDIFVSHSSVHTNEILLNPIMKDFS